MSKINVKITQFSLISCLLISTFQLKAQKSAPKTLVDIPLESNISLYYSANKTGTYQIYKKDAAGEKQLTDDVNFNFWGLKISPDKKKFICYRSPKGLIIKDNNSKNAELWLFNIDGTNGEKLISLTDYKWRSHNAACWSPDGKYLLMAAEISDPNDFNRYHWHLMLTDSVGREPVQISTRSTMFADPVFSPDGKYIAYSALSEGTPYSLCPAKFMEIYVAQFDTTSLKLKNERKLTSNDFWDGAPCFTAEGQEIVYSIAPGCLNQVEYMDLQMVNLNGKVYDIKTDKSSKTNAVLTSNGSIYFQYRPGLTGNSCIARISTDGDDFTIIYQGSNFSVINPQIIEE